MARCPFFISFLNLIDEKVLTYNGSKPKYIVHNTCVATKIQQSRRIGK
jgi:hypothetical protein